MPDPHKNFAYGAVLTAPSPATSGTSLVLGSGQGALFPQPSTDGAFNIVIWPTGVAPTAANAEIARVTARATDTLTITRAQEGSAARTVVVGDQVDLGPTAKVFADMDTLIAASAGDTILCAAPTGVAATDNANFAAGLTAASGGTLQLRKGTYNLTAAQSIPSFTRIVGDKGTIVQCTVSGVFFDFTGLNGIVIEGVKFLVAGTSMTLFYMNGAFQCTFSNVWVQGTHTVGSPQPAQIGFDFLGNAGDSRMCAGCQFLNLGIGIRVGSCFNYLSDSSIINCQYSVYGANTYAAGMMIDNCTLASTPGGTTISHIYIPNAGNRWYITNTDMEGATNTIRVGSGTIFDGPTQFSMVNCELAGTTKILDIQSSYGTTLVGVGFTADPSTTPTSLTINATGAPDNGYAMGLITNVAADADTIAASLFPAAWTYLGRVESKVGATPATRDYSTKIATTAYADQAVARRVRNQAWMPSAAICETFPRDNRGDACTVSSTGVLYLCGGLLIPAGVTVTNCTFISSSTAAGTPTNWWFVLVDQALNVLRKTADQTTTAWAANTVKTLAYATTFTPSVDTPVYAGYMVKATVVPSFVGSVVSAGGSAHAALAPMLSGQSTSALTTPASLGATAAAMSVSDLVYAYLS